MSILLHEWDVWVKTWAGRQSGDSLDAWASLHNAMLFSSPENNNHLIFHLSCHRHKIKQKDTWLRVSAVNNDFVNGHRCQTHQHIHCVWGHLSRIFTSFQSQYFSSSSLQMADSHNHFHPSHHRRICIRARRRGDHPSTTQRWANKKMRKHC